MPRRIQPRRGAAARAPSEAPESSEIPSAHLTPHDPSVGTVPSVAVDVSEGGLVEDFGKDKDLRNLLKSLQPKPFVGEGSDVPKILEEWIITMDDYFQLAGYNEAAKGVLARAKLDGSAKTWWKSSCPCKRCN